jgi:hypothetical protein
MGLRSIVRLRPPTAFFVCAALWLALPGAAMAQTIALHCVETTSTLGTEVPTSCGDYCPELDLTIDLSRRVVQESMDGNVRGPFVAKVSGSTISWVFVTAGTGYKIPQSLDRYTTALTVDITESDKSFYACRILQRQV